MKELITDELLFALQERKKNVQEEIKIIDGELAVLIKEQMKSKIPDSQRIKNIKEQRYKSDRVKGKLISLNHTLQTLTELKNEKVDNPTS